MKITALSIADSKPWSNGDKLLAFFTVEYAGLRLHECLLIRAARDGQFLLAQPPRGDSRQGERRAIEITDPEIRKAMAEAAYNAFLALGGTETNAA